MLFFLGFAALVVWLVCGLLSKSDSVRHGCYYEDCPEEEDNFVTDAAEGYLLYKLLSGSEKKHSAGFWSGDFSDADAVKDAYDRGLINDLDLQEAYDNGVIDEVDVDCINPDAIDYEDY